MDDDFWFLYDLNKLEKDEQKKACKKCEHWKACKGNLKKCKFNKKKHNIFF